MGVDFSAILSHPFDDSTILLVPEILNADQEQLSLGIAEFQAFLKRRDYYPLLEDKVTWQWMEGIRRGWKGTNPKEIFDEYVTLSGPAILSVKFGRASCDLSAPLRWSQFATDHEAQSETRKICNAIVKAFSGSEAIYLPDSAYQVSVATDLVYEHKPLDEIKHWLQANIGNPSDTIEDTHRPMERDYLGGYYIDDFRDMDAR